MVIPYKSNNVILIPQTATVEVQDKKYVYVVKADNKVASTMIEVAQLDNGADYLVTAGLKPATACGGRYCFVARRYAD